MKLTTPVDISPIAKASYDDRFVLIGSCFTEHIAERMRRAYMQVCENPFGILYNPASIAQCINWLQSDRLFTLDDLTYYDGMYHSMMHHGKFSMPDADHTLSLINTSLTDARQFIKTASPSKLHFIFTFGTAYVYSQADTIVGNCHKMPASQFKRKRLKVSYISALWNELLQQPKMQNTVFTVSPIRHLKDGLHQNQLSKSTLLLAVDELSNKAEYFPSYEIMIDELLDYRFYAEDMLHPSDMAVDYIWQRFREYYFTPDAQQQIAEAESVYQLMHHRVLHPETQQAQQFEIQKQQKYNNLKQKYPWIENY